MKSPQAQKVDPDNIGRYSDLQVLESPAGWYIGTYYRNPRGYIEPGSRESGYFPIKTEAEMLLREFEHGDLTNIRLNP